MTLKGILRYMLRELRAIFLISALLSAVFIGAVYHKPIQEYTDTEQQFIQVTAPPVAVNEEGTEITINGPIVSVIFYWEAFIALADSSNKEITIHLTTPGGSDITMYALAKAIRLAPGEVHIKVTGMAASAGAIIASSADKLTMEPGSVMMFHDAQVTVVGVPRSSLLSGLSAMGKEYERFLRTYMNHMLTDREIDFIMNGKDLWLTGEEAQRRFEKGIAKKIAQPL